MNKQPTHAAPKVALDDVKQPGDYGSDILDSLFLKIFADLSLGT